MATGGAGMGSKSRITGRSRGAHSLGRLRAFSARTECVAARLGVPPERLHGVLAVLERLAPRAWAPWAALSAEIHPDADAASDVVEWMLTSRLLSVRSLPDGAGFRLTDSGRRMLGRALHVQSLAEDSQTDCGAGTE